MIFENLNPNNEENPVKKPTTPVTKTATIIASVTGSTAPMKRIAPDLTEVSTSVPMPTRVNRRGSKSLYPFKELPVGGSFGVKNKTAATLASIISNQNRKHLEEEKNEKGETVFETQELKGADGTVTQVPTDKPKMVRTKHFFAHDVIAKDDPDGASVRIFRDI